MSAFIVLTRVFSGAGGEHEKPVAVELYPALDIKTVTQTDIDYLAAAALSGAKSLNWDNMRGWQTAA